MKKILLLALPLMVMCFASCEKDKGEEWVDDSPIIQFKDPKFQQALLNSGTCALIDENQNGYYPYDIDRNGDGQISEKEASIVQVLNIGEAGIRNLEEVKYFTALQILNCDGNELTTLDLSNNIALEQLYCYSNQLTTLDLSNNTALYHMLCGYNQFTTLDLSRCPALNYLDCSYNQFTTLDLSRCPALNYLDCSYNQLTSLDLSKNTALTSLDCYDNQLASLDVSNNTALESLNCYDNQLTSLNVSGCAALIDLSCENNPLTSLDVSKCKKIVLLRCAVFAASDIENTLDLNTKCPLESLKIYKYHVIRDDFMSVLETLYGDIIEYVE